MTEEQKNLQAEREKFQNEVIKNATELAEKLKIDANDEFIDAFNQSCAIEENRLRGIAIEEFKKYEKKYADDPEKLAKIKEELIAPFETGITSAIQTESIFGTVKAQEEAIHAKEEAILSEVKSLRDGLTGIGNRVSFNREMEQRKEKRGELSIIMVDVDYFKKINDTYGHPTGDYVLTKIAEILEKNLRIKDGDFVARYGGEEFIIIASNTATNGDGSDLAERLRKIIERTEFEFEGRKIKVTISTGVSPYDGNLKETISNADVGLYLAKHEKPKIKEGITVEERPEDEESRNQTWYLDKTGKFRKK